MAVSLTKGQRVAIDNSLKLGLIGLGWDTNKYDGGYDFDLDASVFLLGANGKVRRDEDFVFYNNLVGADGAVVHQGDNLTGSGNGDDEVIVIDFTKIPQDVEKIAVAVTIFEADQRRQNFGQVSNAYVRLARMKDEFDLQGETLLQFDLEEEFSIETSLVVCEIYRRNGEWKFNAVASGFKGGLEALCRNYGVNV
ncbi:MAG: TerD family protein [Clostridia bacterium]|nr:TerD family protein [Clostridia bacterium]